ncbi:hypothetical protein WJX82_007031 [Trebouxia sp. C0006]
MLWSGFTASEDLLPRECQLPAARARRRSWRIRIHIAVLLVLYTGWVGFQVVASLFNTQRESKDAFARYLVWSFSTEGSKALQIAVLLVPRLLVQFLAFFTTASFLGWLLFFKEEPAEFRLKHFLQPEHYPMVDIFLPRYKEPWSLYGPVVQSALDINYPPEKLTVYVLDDGRSDPVKQDLQSLDRSAGSGLVYLQRPNGKGAKAANLNHARQYSSGEVILVLDADFISREDALEVVLPHLLDVDKEGGPGLGQIALVQTPQIFYNRNVLMVRFLDGLLKMTYDLWQPSLSGLGMSQCYGTGYVVQRAAIDSIGGWSTFTPIAEDVPTSMGLQAQGWKLKFLRTTIAEGQCPQTLAELYEQRLRWTAGNAQMLCYLRPFADRRLSVVGRISYTMANYGWCIGMLLWVLVSYVMIGWIVFQFLTKDTSISGVAVSLSQFISVTVTGMAFLLIPGVSLRHKLESMMSFMCYMPIFVVVTAATVAGKLRPGVPGLKLKQSSEAAGSAYFPPLACINIITVVAATGLYAVLVSPGPGLQHLAYNYVVCGSQIFFIWFCNWPAIFALVCVVFGITFKEIPPPIHPKAQPGLHVVVPIQDSCYENPLAIKASAGRKGRT